MAKSNPLNGGKYEESSMHCSRNGSMPPFSSRIMASPAVCAKPPMLNNLDTSSSKFCWDGGSITLIQDSTVVGLSGCPKFEIFRKIIISP